MTLTQILWRRLVRLLLYDCLSCGHVMSANTNGKAIWSSLYIYYLRLLFLRSLDSLECNHKVINCSIRPDNSKKVSISEVVFIARESNIKWRYFISEAFALLTSQLWTSLEFFLCQRCPTFTGTNAPRPETDIYQESNSRPTALQAHLRITRRYRSSIYLGILILTYQL